MEARPYNSAHDFLMHASCCSLLEQFFHPRPIPLARLVEVCRSCPTTEAENGTYNVSWSPSYNYERYSLCCTNTLGRSQILVVALILLSRLTIKIPGTSQH
jgi:hypothetical protein